MAKGKKVKEVAPPTAPVTQAITQVAQVSPQQQRINQAAEEYWQWKKGEGKYAGKPLDITEAPGMENYLDIYGTADALAQQKRIGNPLAAFSRGANAGFAKQLEQQNAMDRYNIRAGALSSALSGLENQALGLTQEGAQAAQAQKEAYAALMQGQYSDYWNRQAQKKTAWDKFMDVGRLVVGGASAAAGLGARPFGS